MLLELYDDILTNDVVARFNIDYTIIRDFAFYILSNPAQRMTYRKLQAIFSLGTNVPQKYLNQLEEVFLCFTVKAYATKVKEQVNTPKKVYPIDTGLINAIAFKLSENIGPLLETLVYIELKRRKLEIYFGNFENRYEVDFIVKAGMDVKNVINVTYDMKNDETRKREIDGLTYAT